ncbi:hypothetical protein RX880_07880 [Pseudomonas syringae pv. actinidiae]|nr:hypothetical protein [Pseudomonas syringae pv. actinidiae]MDU8099227.1 hypothetical protein [Pseudomonas syringae pv. actinidiae]MDU8115751.1 hypothetical protein [Pseudomonas syringae pv. actinidiae]MDU8131847.1 hypothetical protein [Pseudomonas syringae pv. actinidiae]MDU8153123.1 hypothetical protein [Pseudomonas syringae pv. actinidiae]
MKAKDPESEFRNFQIQVPKLSAGENLKEIVFESEIAQIVIIRRKFDGLDFLAIKESSLNTRNALALAKRINSFINADDAVNKLLKSALATGSD